MNTTLFLAQIWGPVLVAVGLGLLSSRSQYEKVYRDIANEPLAGLTFGILAMTVGLVQIRFQNSWENLAATLVTLLGWGTLLKGALFVIAPHSASYAARKWGHLKVVPISATLVLLIGAYLIWFGYVA